MTCTLYSSVVRGYGECALLRRGLSLMLKTKVRLQCPPQAVLVRSHVRLHCTRIPREVSRTLRLLLVPGGVGVYHVISSPLVAHCKHRHAPTQQRLLLQRPSHDKELQFDWAKFWELISPELKLLLVAILSAMVAAVLNIFIPLELGKLINTVAALEPGQETGSYLRQLSPSGARLAALYLTQSVFTFAYITVLSVVGERLAVRLRTALFHSLVQQDIAFFDVTKTGELVSRLSGDVQDLKSSFKLVVSHGLRSLTQTIGCVTSLFFISPQMTGTVGVALPVMIAVGTLFGSVLRKWSRQSQEQVARATGVADEALSNVRTVRSFAMEDSEARATGVADEALSNVRTVRSFAMEDSEARATGVADEALSNVRTVRSFATEDSEARLYCAELEKSQHISIKLGTGIALFQGLSNLAINAVVLGVVSQGGYLLATNQLTAGELMSFLVATQTIQRSLGTLSVLFGQVVRGLSAGARVFEYMAATPSVPLRGGATLATNQIRGAVEFRNVTFAYPSRSQQVVLEEFSLTLPPGKVTALCGLSGGGKSTVASLLERFYEPNLGCILLDDEDISKLDPSWLRRDVIGFIKQEPVLFASSVLENIRYGRPEATDEEVRAAAKLANADEFIRSFPEGYSTVVGERGVAVSGGQKQRIAIARALLKNPRVLILDEATSALDAHSERLVQEALDRASEGRTVLVIAHRLSTIQGADQIAVLHRGQLREVGSHAELVAKRGLYAELIRRQTYIAS